MSAFKSHNIRDVSYDFHVSKTIPGFREHVLIYNDQKGPKPWFTSRGTYMALAVFGLSWIQRIKFINNSTRVKFVMKKMILN